MNEWKRQLERAEHYHAWYRKAWAALTAETPAAQRQSIEYWRGYHHGQVNALMAVRQYITSEEV